MTNNLMKKAVKEQEIKYIWAICAVKVFALKKLDQRKGDISTINKFNPETAELFYLRIRKFQEKRFYLWSKGHTVAIYIYLNEFFLNNFLLA